MNYKTLIKLAILLPGLTFFSHYASANTKCETAVNTVFEDMVVKLVDHYTPIDFKQVQCYTIVKNAEKNILKACKPNGSKELRILRAACKARI